MISPIKSLSLFFKPMDLKKSLPPQWNRVVVIALGAIGILVLLYRAFASHHATRRPAVRQIPMNEQLIQSKNNILRGIFPYSSVDIHTESRIVLIVEKNEQRFHQSVIPMDSTNYEEISRTFSENINQIVNLNEIPNDATVRLGIIFTNPNLDIFSKGIGSTSINGDHEATLGMKGIIINDENKQFVSQQLDIPTELLFDN